MYLLPFLAAQESCLGALQCKILNNILYLNKKLFQFGKIVTCLCCFCKNIKETLMHLFNNCDYVITSLVELREYYKYYINLIELTLQTTTLDYIDTKDE